MNIEDITKVGDECEVEGNCMSCNTFVFPEEDKVIHYFSKGTPPEITYYKLVECGKCFESRQPVQFNVIAVHESELLKHAIEIDVDL